MTSEDEARQLLPHVTEQLTALPNVVGVGVVTGDEPDSPSMVAVYVRAKLPQDALQPDEVVPETVKGIVDGKAVEAPTRVIEVGAFRL